MENNNVLLTEKMDRETLLAKAEEIGKLAEAESFEADKNAFLSDKLCQAMKEAEFHKLLKPKRYGGYSVELKPYTEMIRAVARHSMAAAWLAYFYSAHEVWPAYLPPKGRDIVLGGDTLLADVVAPVGKTEKEGDGFRLYGQWNFCSGVLSADWIGLGAMAELEEGNAPEYCLFVLPKSDVTIVRNWDTIGLRGSGSNGVLVEGTFVPSHMIVPAKNLFATGIPVGGDYDKNDPVYRMPFMPLFLLGFPAVSIGGAERLLSLFQERTAKRVRVFKGGANEGKSGGSQRLLAELTTELNACIGLLDRYVDILEKWQEEGKNVINDEEREELFAIRGHIAAKTRDIAVKVLTTLGGTAIYKGDPVELFVRDTLAVSSHPNSLWEDSMSAYGRTLFGLPGDPVW